MNSVLEQGTRKTSTHKPANEKKIIYIVKKKTKRFRHQENESSRKKSDLLNNREENTDRNHKDDADDVSLENRFGVIQKVPVDVKNRQSNGSSSTYKGHDVEVNRHQIAHCLTSFVFFFLSFRGFASGTWEDCPKPIGRKP